jgi:Cu-Zn family superoxide dismutase
VGPVGVATNGGGQAISLADAAGVSLGSVRVSEAGNGVRMVVKARGMSPGVHGIHLHETGRCDGPKFASAGGHWNPGMKKHGVNNPQGAHLGDLPNLQIGASGSGSAAFTVAGANMGRGVTMLADSDGTALVVHANADDYKTDPSGASGDRIACAVLAAPK